MGRGAKKRKDQSCVHKSPYQRHSASEPGSVTQENYSLLTYLTSSKLWFHRTSRHTNLRNRIDPSYYTGGYQKNGRKCCMNGSVSYVCQSNRLDSQHFAGDFDWSSQYNIDILRYHGSTNRVTTLRYTSATSTQSDSDTQ